MPERPGINPESSFEVEDDQTKQFLEMAYKKAELALDIHGIQPENFPHDGEEKMAHAREVVLRKNQFAEQDRQASTPEGLDAGEASKYAMVMEAIFTDPEFSRQLLGGLGEIRKTSEYDNIRNGVDAVLQLRDITKTGHQRFIIALDFTYSRSLIPKKAKKIKERVRDDRYQDVVYFESMDRDFRGKLLCRTCKNKSGNTVERNCHTASIEKSGKNS